MAEDKIYYDKENFLELKKGDVIEVNGKKINIQLLLHFSQITNQKIYTQILDLFESEEKKIIITYHKSLKDSLQGTSETEDIEVTKTDMILGLKELSKNSQYKEQAEMFLKKFEPYCNQEIFLEKFKDKVWSTEVDGVNYRIAFNQIWDFMTLPEEEYQNRLKSNVIEKMKKEHFIYTCVTFFKENSITGNYILPNVVRKRLEQLESNKMIDIEAINEITETDNPNIDKIKINPELKEDIKKNMPSELTTLEKAIYTYIKLCKILTYDDEYFAIGNNTTNTRNQQDINYINTVNKQNPQVVCYVFNAIYGKLLEEMGIHHELEQGFFAEYGEGHEYLIFRSDKFLIKADSTTSILTGDLSLVKLNEKIIGLECINDNDQTRQEFEEKLKKVYDYISIQEKKEGRKKIQDYIEEYHQLKNNQKEKISLEEKLRIMAEIIEKMQLKTMDKISCMNYLAKKFCSEEELEKIIVSYVIDTIPTNGNKKASADIIFSIESDYQIKYFQYTANGILKERSFERLKHDFDIGFLKYINEKYKIPGINGKEGRRR